MRIFLLFLSVFLSQSVLSQITIESNTLPKVGDVLVYQNFSAYEDTLAYQENGEDVRWEIGKLNVNGNSEEVYGDISMSELADSFPEANMLLDLRGFEAAAIMGPNSIDIIGVSTGGQGGFGGFSLDSIESAINFENSYTIKQTPLTYGSKFEDGFEVIFTFPASLIPMLDSLDLGGIGAIESIRITTIASKSEEVTAWGTLSLWDTEKEVLKVEQIENTETIIEIGVNVIGLTLWLNLDDFLGGGMGEGFGGVQSLTTYKFLAADLQTSVIEFTENRFADTTGVNFLTVSGRVSGNIMSDTENLSFDDGAIRLFPNPSSDYITLESSDRNFNKDCVINIIDFQGKVALSLSTYNLGSKIDVSQLDPGHYLIQVKSEDKNYLSKMTLVR